MNSIGSAGGAIVQLTLHGPVDENVITPRWTGLKSEACVQVHWHRNVMASRGWLLWLQKELQLTLGFHDGTSFFRLRSPLESKSSTRALFLGQISSLLVTSGYINLRFWWSKLPGKTSLTNVWFHEMNTTIITPLSLNNLTWHFRSRDVSAWKSSGCSLT